MSDFRTLEYESKTWDIDTENCRLIYGDEIIELDEFGMIWAELKLSISDAIENCQ